MKYEENFISEIMGAPKSTEIPIPISIAKLQHQIIHKK